MARRGDSVAVKLAGNPWERRTSDSNGPQKWEREKGIERKVPDEGQIGGKTKDKGRTERRNRKPKRKRMPISDATLTTPTPPPPRPANPNRWC
ncbi:hypothetical protein P170DRAFT_435512 [Aspergillus steynii IBT 23096]|uniref:Uncharacterized protein n=1 Tax=Aspergillus steynii IBT 23096 TaxID=1392250 RepID=A0A2I2GBQ3_9EURO|nr:uncharacterized protein P170DRAFT_435512 [Aspergillus steynii IBT 23096]PLB50312.1 hypothetical protein P170DRAFT_435512 [Aspergillus steynii IBT 23096]